MVDYNKIQTKLKNKDKLTWALLGLGLIFIGLLGKLLLIFGFVVLIFIGIVIYQEKNNKRVKK